LQNKHRYVAWGLIVGPLLCLAGLLFVGKNVTVFLFYLLTCGLGPFVTLYGLSARLCARYDWPGRAAFVLRRLMQVFVIACLCVAVTANVFILSHRSGDGDKPVDVLLVLGAGLYGDVPSPVLAERLRSAVDYMERHPGVRAVVTGGQGPGETVTEGDCMYAYMTARGIDGARISVENTSRNTAENVANARAFLQGARTVGVVTSDFHLYRAKLIVRKAGYEPVGVAAVTPSLKVKLTMQVRETASVVFAWLGRV